MWDLKYRPLRFSDVLGQKGTVFLLKARLRRGTAMETNYIFSGGSGRGKTTLARILSRAILCLNFDHVNVEPCNECGNCRDVLEGAPGAYVEQDAASGGTIDKIRGLVEDLDYGVFNAKKKVYVFDEAHRMSRDAQDVLLKPLEEKRLVGIFCTTEPEKIRGPIRSRCEEYTIKTITREDILERMQVILKSENVPFEDDAVLTVIDYSGGHVRDVVNRLEMISQAGSVVRETVSDYLQLGVVSLYYKILLNLNDAPKAVDLIEQACEKVSPEDVAVGLGEVAMSVFRDAHGLFSGGVFLDTALSKQVFAKYGDSILQVAKYFLSQRYSSKTILLCDVVGFSSGARKVGSAPVVFIQTQASTSDFGSSGAMVNGIATEAAPLGNTSSSAPQNVGMQAPLVSVPIVAQSDLRSDGVGPLGSSDVAALTDLDHLAVPKSKPRGRGAQKQSLLFERLSEVSDLDTILTPEEWCSMFEKTWPGNKRNG